jgi:hypothetical protein
MLQSQELSCVSRAIGFSERSEDSEWNSSMPALRSIGRTEIAITMMPMPPSHCRIARQRRSVGGMESRPTSTVEPVVVRPDMVSKKASV